MELLFSFSKEPEPMEVCACIQIGDKQIWNTLSFKKTLLKVLGTFSRTSIHPSKRHPSSFNSIKTEVLTSGLTTLRKDVDKRGSNSRTTPFEWFELYILVYSHA